MKLSELHLLKPTGSFFLLFSIAVLTASEGCERKEKVVDVHTPGFNLEVNKTTSATGDKGVEIKSQSDK